MAVVVPLLLVWLGVALIAVAGWVMVGTRVHDFGTWVAVVGLAAVGVAVIRVAL